MSKFQQRPQQGDNLSLPNRALSLLEQELYQKLKDVFVSWSVDNGIPFAEGTSVFRWKVPQSQGGAVRVAQEIGPAIQDFIRSEIQSESLQRGESERDSEVALKVMRKVEHEFKIIRNEFKLAKRTVDRLASKDPATKRDQLLTLGRRSMDFALHEEDTAIALDAVRPLLAAAKGLGIANIEQKIQPALSEYRDKTQFQVPVFWRALDVIVGSPALAAQALDGLPQDVASGLICSCTREQYPQPDQYRNMRSIAFEASLQFVEGVMREFERSETPFGVSVARLFHEISAQPVPEESTDAAIDREVKIIYG